MDEKFTNILATLINATEAMNMVKENLVNVKELEKNIKEKSAKINELYKCAEENNKTTEEKLLQAENLLIEVKQLAEKKTDIDIEDIKNQISNLMSNSETSQQDKKNNENNTNSSENTFIGKEFKIGNLSYVIKQHFGKLNNNNWPLELNLISWDGRSPSYDLRPFSNDHKSMGKGFGVSKNIIIGLKNILNKIDVNSIPLPKEHGQYKIIEHLGSISNNTTWKYELNIISQPNSSAKFDLRSWSSDHSQWGKHISLNNAELQNLKDILNKQL